MVEALNLCRACNFAGNDCCHTPHVIFIGVLEAIKIHQETGLKYSDFLVFTEFDEDQFHEAFDELLPTGKTIALIQHPIDRTCVFFTKNGCKIPHLRPFICRVYPLWYDQEVYKKTGTISLILEDRACPLRDKISEFKSIKEGCRFFGTSEEELKEIFRKAFDHYKMARTYELLFRTLPLDEAFVTIEKCLQTIADADHPFNSEKMLLEVK